MNINCPKCGFNQPEDQYCANCGIDISTFEPPKKPLWQRVVSNWIFQLGMLLFIVIVLVSRDIIFPPRSHNVDITNRNLPPVELKSYRGNEIDNYEAANAPVRPPPSVANAKKVAPPQATTKPSPAAKKPTKEKVLQQKLGAFFYLASREQIDFLLSQGVPVEDGVLTVPISAFVAARKERPEDWKNLQSRGGSFQFGTAKLLVFGDADRGFFFRVTPVDQPDPEHINVEIRSWYEFIKDKPVDGLASALSLSRREVLIVTGFAPKTGLLSAKDSKSANPVIGALASPQFREDHSDLILVLQFK